MVDANTSLQELFDIVVKNLDDVNAGEVFIVKELFRGFEWNRIRKSNRTKLGSMVFAYANGDEGSAVLEPLYKTPQNQQKYKKL